MVKGIALILSIFITSVLFGQEVVIYADIAYPPYSYLENNEVKGIYTTILQKAFSQMDKYEIKIKAIPWKRGLDLLESGEGFALYPPYYHPEARPYMDYSVPILEEKVVVIGRREVLEGFKRRIWPDDFFGLTIIQNEGYNVGGQAYYIAVKNGFIFEKRAKTIQACLLMLGTGRADAYINDRLAILSVWNTMIKNGTYTEGVIHSYLIEGPTINNEWGYLGVTNRGKGRFPFKREFVLEFNNIISKMKENGEIKGIVNDFIIRSMK